MSAYQVNNYKRDLKNPLSSLPARRLSKNKAEVTTRSTGIRMLYIMLPMLQYFFSLTWRVCPAMFRYRLHLVGRQATLLMNFQLPNDNRTSTQWKECASLWLDLEWHGCTLSICLFLQEKKYTYNMHTYVHILIRWCPQVLHSAYKHICIPEIRLFSCFFGCKLYLAWP